MRTLHPVENLFVFGDSLADDGGTFGTFPLAPLFGAAPFPVSPPYDDGRYSNGPLWTEYLAEGLGVESIGGSRETDRNFAIAGATSGLVDDPTNPLQTLGNFQGQIGLFEENFGRFATNDLAAVFFGPNDIAPILRQVGQGAMTLEEGLSDIAANIINGLDRLSGSGAERFLVLGLPDLALVPELNRDPEALMREFGIDLAGLTEITRSLNGLLESALRDFQGETGLQVTFFDSFSLFEEIVADPAAFGIENVTEEILLTSSGSSAPIFNPAIDGQDPAVADATLFFDQEFHPTTAVHEILANRILDQLAEDAAVPEATRTIGTQSDDRLTGTFGTDVISGREGDDRLVGRGGRDSLLGGDGDDHLFGGRGDDKLMGDGGADHLFGGRGADWLDGGQDDDLLFGGGGADALIGSNGDDRLFGGRGDDSLAGGTGDDLLFGQGGDDTFLFEAGFGQDTIFGFDPDQDYLDFRLHEGITAFEDLDIVQERGRAVISDGEGHSVTIHSAQIDEMTAFEIII